MTRMLVFSLSLALALAGCSTTSQLITTKEHVVITPSDSMYYCPTGGFIPNAETLTDLEVARLLFDLNKTNKICKNSLESIRKFIVESKKTVETPTQ